MKKSKDRQGVIQLLCSMGMTCSFLLVLFGIWVINSITWSIAYFVTGFVLYMVFACILYNTTNTEKEPKDTKKDG